VVTVDCTNRFAKKMSSKEKEMLITHFQFAKLLGAETTATALEGFRGTSKLGKWKAYYAAYHRLPKEN